MHWASFGEKALEYRAPSRMKYQLGVASVGSFAGNISGMWVTFVQQEGNIVLNAVA